MFCVFQTALILFFSLLYCLSRGLAHERACRQGLRSHARVYEHAQIELARVIPTLTILPT